ncbi:MAG: transcriptional regulator [Ponticaulis sp.]|nr:transcriptional regulator [Ponticaulis sp.]|tara:strand:+ start:27829 stop:28305 length:477 start_codon:yes stop_codon:yes gene_type:complete
MSEHQDVLIALRRITRAIDLHSKKLMRETGLTGPQLLVLEELQSQDRATPSSVAKAVHLSQATVTSIVDRLEKAGLILRVRSESDRRVIKLQLTTEGAAKAKSAPELLQSGFIEEFYSLKDWERHQLISSIQRIAEMMNAEDLDAAPILELGDLKDES